MGTHVHHCLVPVYEPAIHPDAGRGRDRHAEAPTVCRADNFGLSSLSSTCQCVFNIW
jgi:hypothetical protein